jgi:uncharacterized protein YfdQ (DUF2303 family)
MDNAHAIIEAVKQLHDVRTVVVGGEEDFKTELVAVPSGMDLRSIKPFLDEYMQAPERIEGTARLETLASFVAHAVRHKAGSASALFATRGNGAAPKLLSVLDYHDMDGNPAFCRHRGLYEFPVSEEWRSWKAHDDKLMGQAEFAEFLEDRRADIVGAEGVRDSAKEWSRSMELGFATPAKLLELSRGLSVRVNMRVHNAQNLSTGEVAVTYQEEHSDTAGQPLKVPPAFLIQIPVFRAGAVYQLPALLRYQRQGSAIVWKYKLYRTDAAFDHAFTEACDHATEATALPLFYGSPES